MERDPRVTVTIWQRDDPYGYAEVRGRVDTAGGREARAHVDRLARKHRGRDHDDAAITSERVILRVAPEVMRIG